MSSEGLNLPAEARHVIRLGTQYYVRRSQRLQLKKISGDLRRVAFHELPIRITGGVADADSKART